MSHTTAPRALARLTLTRFFRDHFIALYMCDASPRTIDAYEATLSGWRRLTKEPPIRAITNTTLATYKRLRLTADSRSAATINKDLRHLHHLLSKLGPPGPRNKDALGTIDRYVWTRPLRTIETDPRELSAAQLAAAYDAAAIADLPTIEGNNAPTWWRALIVAAYCLAARRGTLMHLPADSIELADCHIHYSGAIDKARRARRKTLHPTLVAHIAKLRPHAGRLFAWPHSEATWYRQWRAIVAAAACAPFRFHDIKRAALTAACGAIQDLFAIKEFADHSTIRTTERFYLSTKTKADAVISALPMPTAFASISNRQLRLF